MHPCGPPERSRRPWLCSGFAALSCLGFLLGTGVVDSAAAQERGQSTVLVAPGLGQAPAGDVAIQNNTPPVASSVQLRTGLSPDAPRIFAFAAADPDVGDRLRFTIAAQPARGRIINNNDGTFLFDPAGGFEDLAPGGTRQVEFRYFATDRAGQTREGTVTLIVEAKGEGGPSQSSEGARGSPAEVAAELRAGESKDAAAQGSARERAETSGEPGSGRAGDQGSKGRQTSGSTPAAGEPSTKPQQDAAAVVDMTGELTFEPKTITIPVGGTVLWKNPSNVVHTVTADPNKAADPSHVHLPEGATAFDSGTIQPGGTYRHRFTVPGRYQYVCLPHEMMGMIGEVIVEEKSQKDAQAAPSGQMIEPREAEPNARATAETPNGQRADTIEAAPKSHAEKTEIDRDESTPSGAEERELAATVDLRSDVVKRGEYLFHAGGCASCHTDRENDGAPLAGGRRLVTAFGTFYGSNITPDLETGIGTWSEADFLRAMKTGIAPDGSPYYPVFPYRWYASLYDFDLRDLWAYLRTLTPVRNEVPPHDLAFPLSQRALIHGWRLFDFEPAPAPAHPGRSRLWNRGSYLVNALAHCGACHTTKSALGTFRDEMFLAGSSQIPGGFVAPNITPDRETGIGSWSKDDMIKLLRTGMRPDGAPVGGPMAEMVSDTTSRLTDEDREAIATYLQSVPPISYRPQRSEAANRQHEATR